MDDDRHFQGCHAPWFLFELLYTQKIDPTEFILYLTINSFQQYGRRCYMTNEVIGRRVGLKDKQAVRHIENLERLGLLYRSQEIELGSFRRYVVAVNPYQEGGGIPADPQAAAQMTRPAPVPPKATKTPKPVTAGWAVRMAALLADTISKSRKVNRTSKISEWAKFIERIFTKDGIPKRRIKAAMRWYCAEAATRHRERYFVVVESGSAFRDKFDKIESMMVREQTARKVEDGEGDDHNEPEPTITPSRVMSAAESRRALQQEDE